MFGRASSSSFVSFKRNVQRSYPFMLCSIHGYVCISSWFTPVSILGVQNCVLGVRAQFRPPLLCPVNDWRSNVTWNPGQFIFILRNVWSSRHLSLLVCWVNWGLLHPASVAPCTEKMNRVSLMSHKLDIINSFFAGTASQFRTSCSWVHDDYMKFNSIALSSDRLG